MPTRKSPRFPNYLTGGVLLTDPIARPPQARAPIEAAEQAALSPLLRGYDRLCRRALGVGARKAHFPGGRDRAAFILTLEDGREIVAARREDPARGALEAEALMRLETAGAPTARLLYFNGAAALTERIPGPRLAQVIADNPEQAGALAADALQSLGDLHEAASSAGMDGFGPIIGASVDWLRVLVNRPRILGDWLDVPAPGEDYDEIIDLLTCYEPRFVKWDARSGNAIYTPEGAVRWFDLEHCGARNRLDDMVWLLGDEILPDDEAVEHALIEAAIDIFADERGPDEARAYFYAMGCFHCSVRLGALLDHKGDGPWKDASRALKGDRLISTLEHCRRLCLRGARWAQMNRATRPLASWWRDAGEALERLDKTAPKRPSQGAGRKRARRMQSA